MCLEWALNHIDDIYIYIYIYDSYATTCRSDQTIEQKCLGGWVASLGEGGSVKKNGMNEQVQLNLWLIVDSCLEGQKKEKGFYCNDNKTVYIALSQALL